MIEKLVRRDVGKLPQYVPGKSKEEVVREFGLQAEDVVKLASNENPFGPSPMAIREIRLRAEEVNTYPDSGSELLRKELARHYSLSPENIIVGNGSDEVLDLAVKAFLNPGEEVVIPVPTFSMYESTVKLYNGRVVKHPLTDSFEYDIDGLLRKITSKTKIVFVCSPNNPTGSIISVNSLRRLLENDVIVILDEAYAEFAVETGLPLVREYENLLVLRTFSKAYGLAGLRVGYGVGNDKLIDYIFRVKPPFNVNLLAQCAAIQALRDKEHLDQTVARTIAGRKFLAERLRELDGVKVYPSQGNFILLEITNGASANKLAKELLKDGVIVRSCESFGLGDSFLRVSIGREEENKRFLNAFEAKLKNYPHTK